MKFRRSHFLIFCLCVVVLIPVVALKAASASSNFQDAYEVAQQAYYAQDYDTALKGFQELLAAYPNNPAVFYNLGNTYYQKGELGHARQYYEKAKLQLPRLQNLQKNLTRLISDLKLPEQNSLESFLQQTFYFWQSHFTLFEVQILSLGTALGLVVLMSSRFLKTKRILSFATVTLVVLHIYVVTGTVIKKMNEEPSRYAIVLTSAAEVKSNYLDQSHALLTLPEGVRVKIIDAQVFNQGQAWYRLELPDGQTGWTLQQNLGQI